MATKKSTKKGPQMSIDFQQEMHDMWEVVKDERNEMTDVKTQLASLTTEVAIVAKAITKLTDERREDKKQPWAVYISAMALIAALGSSVLDARLSPLEVKDQLEAERAHEHYNSEGHPEAMEKHAAIAATVVRLDGDIEDLSEDLEDLEDKEKANLEDARSLRMESRERLSSLEAKLEILLKLKGP